MTHETESALRARILELENGNAYLHDVMERAESEASAQIAELRAVNSEQADKIVALQKERAKTEILQGAYDTAKDHTNALNAENARLREDKKNLNITIENAAEWSEKQAAKIAELEAVNSEHADKIVDLQNKREEHLRTIAELMAEKAELLKALRISFEIHGYDIENDYPHGYADAIENTRILLEKHGVK